MHVYIALLASWTSDKLMFKDFFLNHVIFTDCYGLPMQTSRDNMKASSLNVECLSDPSVT